MLNHKCVDRKGVGPLLVYQGVDKSSGSGATRFALAHFNSYFSGFDSVDVHLFTPFG
jgi:hypothetical protein